MADKYFTVEGNSILMDGGGMFGSAPKTLWKKWINSNDENQLRLATRCLLVQTKGFTILAETGVGSFMEPKLGERYGIDTSENKLLTNLSKNGVNESDVDYVILSHLHFDHIGGILPQWPGMQEENWDLHFPNAKYVTGCEQFERAKTPHPRDRASYVQGLCEKLEQSGRLILIDEENKDIPELNEFLSLEISTGHTPDMIHALVNVDGKKLFFASDLIPGAPWIHLPITAGYDRHPELVVDEKQAILERAVKEEWIIVFTHDPDVSAAHVTFDQEKRKYQALPEPI